MKATLPSLFTLGTVLTALTLSAVTDPGQLAAAVKLFEAGKNSEAESAFEKLAAGDKANPEVNYHLGQLALRRQDPEKAVSFLEQAAEKSPNVARYEHALGDAYGLAAQKASIFSQLGLAKKCLARYQ